MTTPQDTVALAEISQYLWGQSISQDNSFANGSLNTGRDQLLYMQRKSVQYAINQNLPYIDGVAKNLYHLCGAKLQEAFYILNNGSSGGTVTPPVTGNTFRSYTYAFIVGQSIPSPLVLDGGNAFSINIGSGATLYNDYSLIVGQTSLLPIDDSNTAGFSCTYDPTTQLVTFTINNNQKFQNTQSVYFTMNWLGNQTQIITPVL